MDIFHHRAIPVAVIALFVLLAGQSRPADDRNGKTKATTSQPARVQYADVPLSPRAKAVLELIRDGNTDAAEFRAKDLGDDPAKPALQARLLMAKFGTVSPFAHLATVTVDEDEVLAADHVRKLFRTTAQLDKRLAPFVADCIMDGITTEMLEDMPIVWHDHIFFSNKAAPIARLGNPGGLAFVYFSTEPPEELIPKLDQRRVLNEIFDSLRARDEAFNDKVGPWEPLLLQALEYDTALLDRWGDRHTLVVKHYLERDMFSSAISYVVKTEGTRHAVRALSAIMARAQSGGVLQIKLAAIALMHYADFARDHCDELIQNKDPEFYKVKRLFSEIAPPDVMEKVSDIVRW